MKEVTTLELLKDIYIKADLLDLKITHLYDDVDDRDMRIIKDLSVRLLREINNKIAIEEQELKKSKANSAYHKLFEIEKQFEDGIGSVLVYIDKEKIDTVLFDKLLSQNTFIIESITPNGGLWGYNIRKANRKIYDNNNKR